MQPGDSRRNSIPRQQRSYLRPVPTRDPRSDAAQAAQQATAGIVRNQIDTIFQQGGQGATQPQPQTTQDDTSVSVADDTPQVAQQEDEAAASFAETSHNSPNSPYDRTHEKDRTELHEGQWKQYHSAWQDYYRQYYERYYLGEVYRMRQTATADVTPTSLVNDSPLVDNDEAFHNLRSDLLQNVRGSASKVRSSRHFMPLIAASLTVLLFMFLQYNRVLFANVEAYVSPGSINPANIIVDPNIKIPISNEPRLIIPKINVDVPVVYDTRSDHASQLKAMERGVAWFGIPGANSRPGQLGNTVLSGHSSNDLFDPGDHKFIFARLEQLAEGDTFHVHYLGERYTYNITKKEVVKPTDVHKLVYPPEKAVVTLVTCVPLGTAQNRLLVTAEQVSPSPELAKAAPNTTSNVEEVAMPGNTPSFLSRLFGS